MPDVKSRRTDAGARHVEHGPWSLWRRERQVGAAPQQRPPEEVGLRRGSGHSRLWLEARSPKNRTLLGIALVRREHRADVFRGRVCVVQTLWDNSDERTARPQNSWLGPVCGSAAEWPTTALKHVRNTAGPCLDLIPNSKNTGSSPLVQLMNQHTSMTQLHEEEPRLCSMAQRYAGAKNIDIGYRLKTAPRFGQRLSGLGLAHEPRDNPT